MGDLLKMYSFSASSESRMRVSLTLVTPLTATVGAAESETTSAAADGFTGSGAGVTGVEVDAVVATGSGAGVFTTGASFLAIVTGSGLLGKMLLTGIPAEGFDFELLAAIVSTFAGAGVGFAVTGWAVVWITGSDFGSSGAG